MNAGNGSDRHDTADGRVPASGDYRAGGAFIDVMPVLADPDAFRTVLGDIVRWAAPLRPQYVAGIDAGGFILGGALADRLGCGFLAVRKAGKLPGRTVTRTLAGGYAGSRIELRRDLVPPGSRILVHDDIVSTGTSVSAAAEMLEGLGATVAGITCLVEKAFSGGRPRIARLPFYAVYAFES
jgi:adenine phosphoribosyltransferase